MARTAGVVARLRSTALVAAAAAALLASPGAPAVAEPALPNLVPDLGGVWVDYEWIEFDSNGYRFGPALLSFELRTQNLGEVPLDLRPDDVADLSHSTVSQCTDWVAGLVCSGREPVAGTAWDEAGLHHRIGQFASYELRRLDEAGGPDFSDAGLLSSRRRGVGCVGDDVDAAADDPRPPRYGPAPTPCTALEAGISPGWSDSIPAQTAEQDVPLDGIDDGRYALLVTVNPAGLLHESSHTDNRVIAVVDIEGKNQPFPEVTVVAKWHG